MSFDTYNPDFKQKQFSFQFYSRQGKAFNPSKFSIPITYIPVENKITNAGIIYLLFQKMSGDPSEPNSVLILVDVCTQNSGKRFCASDLLSLSPSLSQTPGLKLPPAFSICCHFHLPLTYCHNSMYWMAAANKTIFMALWLFIKLLHSMPLFFLPYFWCGSVYTQCTEEFPCDCVK